MPRSSIFLKQKCKVQFALPEFSSHCVIVSEMHVTKETMGYDIIMGRDLLKSLGIIINVKEDVVEWDNVPVPMKSHDATVQDSFYVEDSTAVKDASERMKQILDAKYEPANLKDIAESCTNLTQYEQSCLLELLEKYKSLFDGTLGHWEMDSYDIELKPDAEPYHARAYPIPHAYEKTLRMEVQRLCDIGVLRKVNHSEWAAPTFIIPKKDGTVRFISDFRELNKRIKCKPFPIPKIQDLLLKLEGFQYATSLDLNMGYYHIELSPSSKKLCTIVLPFGKYEMQRLPMGLSNSPDIFQEKMSTLMADLEYVRAYIDDLLVLTSGSLEDHLDKLDTVLGRLEEAGLKVNAKKSFFAKPELEYLGYWITREGIMPIAKKVDSIQQIAEPKTKKQLRSFIGMVNYYRDMWVRGSEVLAPLSKLCSKTAKWEWKQEQQTAFELTKKIVSREVLLAYPNFEKPFEIHTDASHTQLGAVISQEGKPIAFYSRKLNDAQTRYTTTERELLSIVETLKEFRNILLGHKITVYTDHQNLTYKNFTTERVMRWRLILEEYGPELVYIKGERNVVADALSRLPMKVSKSSETHETLACLAESFGMDEDELPDDAYPLSFKRIAKGQKIDKKLHNSAKNSKGKLHLKSFSGGGKKRTLLCRDDKIVVPKSLQKRTVEWYHNQLCHPGENRTEQTIRGHFWWKTLHEDVRNACQKCDTCQCTKLSSSTARKDSRIGTLGCSMCRSHRPLHHQKER